MRMRFNFWLNLEKSDEYEIAETIDDLKQKRSFSQTIRDGIRLVNDLRKGNLDVLHEIFPWVFDAIYATAEADIVARQVQPHTPNEPQSELVLQQLARLEAQMERLGALPIERGKPSHAPIPKPFALEDEPEIEIEKAKTGHKSAFNYAISLAKLNDSIASLPDEMIRYGVETGQIPARYLPKEPEIAEQETASTPTKTPTGGDGNIKKMDVPQFEVPSFDDDDGDEVDLFT